MLTLLLLINITPLSILPCNFVCNCGCIAPNFTSILISVLNTFYFYFLYLSVLISVLVLLQQSESSLWGSMKAYLILYYKIRHASVNMSNSGSCTSVSKQGCCCKRLVCPTVSPSGDRKISKCLVQTGRN